MLPLDVALEIRCPRCSGRAWFDEPYEFVSKRARPADADQLHQWGGWLVREKYPSVLPWKPPPGSQQSLYTSPERLPDGHRFRDRGVLRCGECHNVTAHELRWPEDAYFQWTVRGERLWAWNREHAQALRQYLESTQREPARYGLYARSLRELPARILDARARTAIVRKIHQTLIGTGDALPEPE